MTRLLPGDLATLGSFLYGPRWQTRLARAIRRSDRMVRYWAAGDRPLSIVASSRIEVLVRSKHGEQMRRTRAIYLDMVASLSDTAIRGRLLTMDLAELQLDDQLRRAALATLSATACEANFSSIKRARTRSAPDLEGPVF